MISVGDTVRITHQYVYAAHVVGEKAMVMRVFQTVNNDVRYQLSACMGVYPESALELVEPSNFERQLYNVCDVIQYDLHGTGQLEQCRISEVQLIPHKSSRILYGIRKNKFLDGVNYVHANELPKSKYTLF